MYQLLTAALVQARASDRGVMCRAAATSGAHPRSSRIQRRARAASTMVTSVLATAVAFVITSAPASAATRIGWYDFERVDASGQVLSAPTYAPSSEDRIKLLVEPQKAPLGKVEIVLKSDSTITWRKGIQVDGKSCHSTWFGPVCTYPLLTQLYTEGTDHGGDPHAVDAAAAHRLRFGKAKLFGAYTDMYELPMTGAPSRFERARYTFTWVKD